ncbi:hypothetical protein BS47DRAFT_1351495 [Hydnum rufescens UP504]|uniref:Uncharacterized protein n=1 Tax=Hydnum rufescens UP504 TaxID=1448309 RepID=A0A9P6DRE0_9AGAM|nr:hypothetical protein BS47DRAFT_1351495 [Hydnum rufescens UP504]
MSPVMPLFTFLRRRHPVPTPDREAGSYTVDSTYPARELRARLRDCISSTIGITNAPWDSPLTPTVDTQLGDSRFRVLVMGEVSHAFQGALRE